MYCGECANRSYTVVYIVRQERNAQECLVIRLVT
jgi:hypothetical protein